MKKSRVKKNIPLLIMIFAAISLIQLVSVMAIPVGPTINVLSNSTKALPSGTKVNATNDTHSPGGLIFTLGLNSLTQDTRWKGYVGNVTGTFVLDDVNNNRLFSWTVSSISGEVYATRAQGNINWSGINCTWIADARRNSSDGLSSNRTPEVLEQQSLSHTNKDDNITKTFNLKNHSSITVGGVVIGKNECYSVQTYQRSAAQTFDDSDAANFTQVILYDGAFNTSSGNVVYETKIQNDVTGYISTETYDFQMMLPESGAAGFSSSTAYYFYVELT